MNVWHLATNRRAVIGLECDTNNISNFILVYSLAYCQSSLTYIDVSNDDSIKSMTFQGHGKWKCHRNCVYAVLIDWLKIVSSWMTCNFKWKIHSTVGCAYVVLIVQFEKSLCCIPTAISCFSKFVGIKIMSLLFSTWKCLFSWCYTSIETYKIRIIFYIVQN